MSYPVSYNGNDLSLINGIDIYNYEFNELPDRDIKMNKIARADKSLITSSEYTSKTIKVYGEACGGNRGDTEEVLTALKAQLQGQNYLLEVNQANADVTYTATMNAFNLTWQGTTALFEIEFVASDPIGEDANSIIFLDETTSNAEANYTVVFGGSHTVQPTINLVVSAVTGGTGETISVINAGTGQGISITRDWVAGDVVEIDSKDKEVRVNGVLSDFEGLFPTWGAGTKTIRYTDTLTTRTVDIVGTYRRKFI